MSNRLAREKSPYLLQHAHNPVDWYPWGSEAFERARRENRPILVSIGYSTCHWCHVMERESFEDPAAAELMNKTLVCIKVDREERPDIDKIYMSAVTAMTGQGGWPLNVFLTPDLKPFYGGTYFPPEERWGRPSWGALVRSIGESWKDSQARNKILESAENLTDSLKKVLSSPGSGAVPGASVLSRAVKNFRAIYDAPLGGFGGAPKFPMPVYHHFLLRSSEPEAHEMSLNTLRAMARGGIYDQVGGGFHRYSTDERWHIPHFEKMLYDNAQLAGVYLDAAQVSKDPEFLRVARETLDYVLRDLSHPEGGFYSAEDADSGEPKVEGAFYVWEKREIIAVLGPEAGEEFSRAYGVEPDGNAQADPHGEFEHKNILFLADPKAAATLGGARKKLFETRNGRPRPSLDDKLISSWNGLMISAFARAYEVMNEEKDLEAAQKAARFMMEKLYDPGKRILARRWREGEPGVPGTADDYAFLAQGFIDLYRASFDPACLERAILLVEIALERFYDPSQGGFYMTSFDAAGDVLIRVKEDTDNVEPSASSVMASNLLRLASVTGRADFREAAQKTLSGFGATLGDHPMALPRMLSALAESLSKPLQIVIAGDPAAADTQALVRELRSRFIPEAAVLLADGGERQAALERLQPFVKSLFREKGKATAYVCNNYVCDLPVTDPRSFVRLLEERR